MLRSCPPVYSATDPSGEAMSGATGRRASPSPVADWGATIHMNVRHQRQIARPHLSFAAAPSAEERD